MNGHRMRRCRSAAASLVVAAMAALILLGADAPPPPDEAPAPDDDVAKETLRELEAAREALRAAAEEEGVDVQEALMWAFSQASDEKEDGKPAVRFRVLAPDGTPLAKVRVTVSYPHARHSWSTVSRTTDADGVFSLRTSPIAGGRIKVTSGGRGYGRSDPFQAPAEADAPPMEIHLKQGATLSGVAVDKATGKPIRDVYIYLWSIEDNDSFPSPSDRTTKKGGTWEVTDLPPGQWQLVAHADGYSGVEMEINVTEGQQIADLRLELVPFAKVTVVVLAEDGKTPIAGAVCVHGWRSAREPPKTDAQGRFTLTVDPDNGAMLTIVAEGYAPRSELLTVPADGKPGEQRIVLSDRGGTVTGRVTNIDTGKPVAGMRIMAFQVDEERSSIPYWLDNGRFLQMQMEELELNGPRACQRATTDADGRYTIKHAPTGRLVVVGVSDRETNAHSKEFDVASGRTVEIDLSVTRKPMGFISGRVLSPEGKVLARERLSVSMNRYGYWDDNELTTDAQGRYYLKLEEAGTTRFVVMREGCAVIEQTVEVPDLNVAVEIDLSLKAEKADAEIAGRAFLPDGTTPAAGAKVVPFVKDRPWPGSFQTYEDEDEHRYTLIDERAAIVEADGTFRIRGLRPGRYGVYATPHREPMEWSELLKPEFAECLPAMSNEVTVAESGRAEDVRVVLGRGGIVKGQLVDAKSGAAVAGADVQLSWSYGGGFFGTRSVESPPPGFWGMAAVSDAEGRFSLAGVPPGQYGLEIEADGYKSLEVGGWRTIKVMAGLTVERTYKLKAE